MSITHRDRSKGVFIHAHLFPIWGACQPRWTKPIPQASRGAGTLFMCSFHWVLHQGPWMGHGWWREHPGLHLKQLKVKCWIFSFNKLCWGPCWVQENIGKNQVFILKAVLCSAYVALVKGPDNKVPKLYRKRRGFFSGFCCKDFEDFCFDDGFKRS